MTSSQPKLSLLAVAFGLLGTVAGLTGLDGLVWLLQLRGPAAIFAADYLRPLMLLLVFQVIESVGRLFHSVLIDAAPSRRSLRPDAA